LPGGKVDHLPLRSEKKGTEGKIRGGKVNTTQGGRGKMQRRGRLKRSKSIIHQKGSQRGGGGNKGTSISYVNLREKGKR